MGRSDKLIAGCNVFAPCYFSMGANTLHPERCSDGALQPEAAGAPERTGQMTRHFFLQENASLKEHPINLPLRDGPSGAQALPASGGEGARPSPPLAERAQA